MYESEREELVQICHALYQRNLVTASDGNISLRVSPEHILITPSSKNKSLLKAGDVLVIDEKAQVLWGQGKPSREFPMHLLIYQKRKDVAAVIHTHPVYATAFALAGKNIPENYLIEAPLQLRKTGLAAFAIPGSIQMAEAISPHIDECNAILLSNHGALTYGKNLQEAFDKMEVLESVAKTVIMAKLLGEPQAIAEADMEKLKV